MVMLARELVKDGAIGEVRKVEAWYPQGWLATKLEAEGQKQASWRVDPTKAGASGCGGDIGTHAYEFVRFVAGRSATRVRGRLKAFVPGRALDDDFTVLAELDNGGIATIAASQITIGAQNDNGFRVSGTTGTLEWSITDHTVLKHYAGGQPLQLYRQGAEYGYFPGSIKPYLRLPSGHPEGFHEALANLHRTLEWTIRGRGARRSRPRSNTRASSTASPAWRSSRPPSPARTRTGPGRGRGWVESGRAMIGTDVTPGATHRERPPRPVQRRDRRRAAPEVRPLPRGAPVPEPERGGPRPDARGPDRGGGRPRRRATPWGSSP